MALRNATESDFDEICALIHELAVYEHLEHEVATDLTPMFEQLFGPEPAARALLAVNDGGDVVGMALWFRTLSTFQGITGIWLEDLFVRPVHRGKGYGAALLRGLRELTDGRVEWAVLDWNTPSIEFYERLGARPVTGWTRYRWTR